MVFQKQKEIKTWFAALGVLIAFILGCPKDNLEEKPGEFTCKDSIRFCKTILRNPRLPKRSKSLAESALRKWKNDKLDPDPILIRAVLVRPERKRDYILVLQSCDEDHNTLGVVITEVNKKKNGHTVNIKEDYPVYINEPFTHNILKLVTVKIRKNEELKDEEQWQNYLDVGVQNKDPIPDVWISVPNPSKIEIEIQIYDREGRKSAPVILENFLVPDDDPNK